MACQQQALRLVCTGVAQHSLRALATSTCVAAATTVRVSPAQAAAAAAARQRVTWGDLYKLSKGKLSMIVVATAAAGFAAGSGDSLDYLQLLYTCLGTFGCSAAANALNQVYEIRNDGLMRRTMLRPLPAGRMSAAQALLFAAVMGAGGTGLLAYQVRGAVSRSSPHWRCCLPSSRSACTWQLHSRACPCVLLRSKRLVYTSHTLKCLRRLSHATSACLQVNPLTAALGAGNIALYAAVYTPLKQLHPLNTWVGALVGAVPPLMGWTAATNSVDPGAFFMAGILYLWQLPHFMALAWMCKEDYIRGGYRMLSFADPSGRRTAGVALRNALAMVPLGLAAVHLDLVHSPFVYESVALSGAFALSASAFYARPCQQVRRPPPASAAAGL